MSAGTIVLVVFGFNPMKPDYITLDILKTIRVKHPNFLSRGIEASWPTRAMPRHCKSPKDWAVDYPGLEVKTKKMKWTNDTEIIKDMLMCKYCAIY